MINKKKGVSAVVATVFIIMITVAAVVVIWSTVIPLVKNSASEGLKCFDAESNLEIVNGPYTCYNATHNNVQILRGAKKDNLVNISINWINGGNTINTTYVEEIPGLNGMKLYHVLVTEMNGLNPTEISIVPIIAAGDTETTCASIIPVTVSAC